MQDHALGDDFSLHMPVILCGAQNLAEHLRDRFGPPAQVVFNSGHSMLTVGG
jgi:hypothetical protein